MGTAPALTWQRDVRRVLAEGTASVLVWVEGAAGLGKSHLLSQMFALPEAEDADGLLWRCGSREEQLRFGPERCEGPVLLVVDDVHRADARERERLRSLLERPRAGLAAVLAYRPEELATPGLPLGTPVDYPPELTVLRHRLEAWDQDHVRRAAVDVLGHPCTDEAVGRLRACSGGVPRVVVDLLSAVRGSGEPECTSAAVDRAGAPARLVELVLGRVAALPPADRPIVWAAAGRRALLAASEGAVLAELDGGRYGFPVPLAALAVRAAMPGPLRQEMHERAAEVLVRRQPVPWAAVAEHRKAAGQLGGWLRAVEKAARTAAERDRHQEAVDLLERTLASPLVPQRARVRLAPMLARSAVVGLRSDRTVEVLRHLVSGSGLPQDLRGELRLDLGLMLCNQVGAVRAGLRELETAAAELDDVRPDLAGRAIAALAMPHWPGPSIDVHRRWLHEAMKTAEAGEAEAPRAAALANRASLVMYCGDPEAWELVEGLPTDSPDPVCRQHAARGLCNVADAAVWLGFYDRAEALLERGRDLAVRSGAPYTEHTALGTRLLLEWWTGRWAGLDERCETFVTATADMPIIASDARMVRGLLAFAQGDWGTARSWLNGPRATAPENTPTPLTATVAGALVRLALARQDVSEAARLAADAWSQVAHKGVWVWAAELAPWAVEAFAHAGDTAAARDVVDRFAEGVEHSDAPAVRAALLWSRAALAEAENDLPRATVLHRQAAAAYGALPQPYAQALTTEGAARCLLAGAAPEGSAAAADGGDTAEAVEELRRCVKQFSDLGAAWDAARSRARLRTHQSAGPGRPPGSLAQPGELTAREREVADLAASGLTNREIASTLFLSPRTVEQHIARAMRKTGALSRHDLGRDLPR